MSDHHDCRYEEVNGHDICVVCGKTHKLVYSAEEIQQAIDNGTFESLVPKNPIRGERKIFCERGHQKKRRRRGCPTCKLIEAQNE